MIQIVPMNETNPLIVTGPLNAVSGILTFTSIITFILCPMVVTPYVINPKLMSEYPNAYIPFIAAAGFLLNLGFVIGFLFNFDPEKYVGSICTLQWIVFGTGGVFAMLLLFAYTFGLYELVVSGKKGKILAAKQKYAIALCLFIAILCEIAIPFAFPFFDGLVFGPQGPWCAIRSVLVLTVLFYGPSVPASVGSLILAFRIIYVVRKTTNAAMQTGNAISSPKNNSSVITEHDKHKAERQNRLNKFYARVSIYVIIFSMSTIGSCIKRIIELRGTVWRDPNHKNDPTVGISILLPLFCCVQIIVFASIPAVTKFWSKLFNYGKVWRYETSRTGASSGKTDNVKTRKGNKGSVTEVTNLPNSYTELAPLSTGGQLDLASDSKILPSSP